MVYIKITFVFPTAWAHSPLCLCECTHCCFSQHWELEQIANYPNKDDHKELEANNYNSNTATVEFFVPSMCFFLPKMSVRQSSYYNCRIVQTMQLDMSTPSSKSYIMKWHITYNKWLSKESNLQVSNFTCMHMPNWRQGRPENKGNF